MNKTSDARKAFDVLFKKIINKAMKAPLIMIPGTLCNGILFNAQLENLQDLADCRIGNQK